MIQLDQTRFTVGLASTPEEVAAAQRLRYRVFVEEMGARPSPADADLRLERDRFDPHCDHLILIDTAACPADPLDRVVGVYRLLRGDVARRGPGFYGAGEYDLTPLIETPRPTVELGRSCVHPAYRGSLAMHLLWSALGAYVIRNGIEILFGTASFHGADPLPLAEPLSYLYHWHLAPEEIRVRVRPPNGVPMDRIARDAVARPRALQAIPPLIKAYLRLGGVVGDGAWVDRPFNTVDVCLVMDTGRMQARYRDYYGRTA